MLIPVPDLSLFLYDMALLGHWLVSYKFIHKFLVQCEGGHPHRCSPPVHPRVLIWTRPVYTSFVCRVDSWHRPM